MSRHRLLVVAVVAVVALAGCSGVADRSADREPYGVDDPLEPSIVDVDAVPGLTEDGFENRGFADAHAAALANTSYTKQATTNATTRDGTVLFDRRETLAVDASENTARSAVEFRGTDAPFDVAADRGVRVEFWYEGGLALERVEIENRSPRYAASANALDEGPFDDVVRALLYAEETELDAADGRTIVTATEPGAQSGYLADEPFRAEVAIREDGIVEYASLEGTVRRDGERVDRRLEYRIVDVGETDPERPPWYDEALEVMRNEADAE